MVDIRLMPALLIRISIPLPNVFSVSVISRGGSEGSVTSPAIARALGWPFSAIV